MPADDPYDVRKSLTSRERAAKRQAQQASDDFQNSPAGSEIAEIRAELAVLKAENSDLKSRFERLRITGNEFSGQGENISFQPQPQSSAGSTLEIKDEGTSLTTSATSINFVGSTLAATNSGGAVTVTLTPLTIKEQSGSPFATAVTSLDFVGSGRVDVTDLGGGAYKVDILAQSYTDTTDPTNSGSGDASVLKTGTNVVARKLKGTTGEITVTEGTDVITFSLDGGYPPTYELSIIDGGDDGTGEVTSAATSIEVEGETIAATATGAAAKITMLEQVFDVFADGILVQKTIAAKDYTP